MADNDTERAGLLGSGAIAMPSSWGDCLGSWPQLGIFSESKARELRSKAGLLCKGVGVVSMLCRENTDDDMLLSVKL